jgi:hypothetical protein
MVPTWKNAKAVAVLAIIVDKARSGKRLNGIEIIPTERDGYEGYSLTRRHGYPVTVKFHEHRLAGYIEVIHGDACQQLGEKTFGGDDYANAADYVMKLLGIYWR